MVVKINTEYIKLVQLLKLTGEIVNGGEAKELLENGQVLVNNIIEKARGKKVYPGFMVKVGNNVYTVELENVN